MINYKSFKLPGNAKLRVRSDHIVATVNSSNGKTLELFVAGVANPWHIPIDEETHKEIVDYIWERHAKEEDD